MEDGENVLSLLRRPTERGEGETAPLRLHAVRNLGLYLRQNAVRSSPLPRRGRNVLADSCHSWYSVVGQPVRRIFVLLLVPSWRIERKFSSATPALPWIFGPIWTFFGPLTRDFCVLESSATSLCGGHPGYTGTVSRACRFANFDTARGMRPEGV